MNHCLKPPYFPIEKPPSSNQPGVVMAMMLRELQEVDEIHYPSAYNPNGTAWGDPDWLGRCFFHFFGGQREKYGCLIT